MTDPVAEILQDFQAEVDHATARAMDRLRAIASASSDAPSNPLADGIRMISVGAAGHYANLTDGRIRQLCKRHYYGSSPGGFGFKLGGRWQVADHNFRQYLAGVRHKADGAQDAK